MRENNKICGNNTYKVNEINGNYNKLGDKNTQINNKNNNNYYKFKKVINVDDNKKNKRPGLREKEGKIIPFEAMLVRKYNNTSITIINIHSGDKYMADHTQLDLKKNVEDFLEEHDFTTNLIRSVGGSV